MYQDSKCMCTAIVWLILPLVCCRSRRRRHHGLLKLPTISVGTTRVKLRKAVKLQQHRNILFSDDFFSSPILYFSNAYEKIRIR